MADNEEQNQNVDTGAVEIQHDELMTEMLPAPLLSFLNLTLPVDWPALLLLLPLVPALAVAALTLAAPGV